MLALLDELHVISSSSVVELFKNIFITHIAHLSLLALMLLCMTLFIVSNVFNDSFELYFSSEYEACIKKIYDISTWLIAAVCVAKIMALLSFKNIIQWRTPAPLTLGLGKLVLMKPSLFFYSNVCRNNVLLSFQSILIIEIPINREFVDILSLKLRVDWMSKEILQEWNASIRCVLQLPFSSRGFFVPFLNSEVARWHNILNKLKIVINK